MFNDSKKPRKPNDERRQYVRIKKSFILSYFNPADPDKKFEITQLKNISLGGMCFVTTRNFEPSVELIIELKTPYISETTHLEGVVLQSHEKMTGKIYETRIQFKAFDTEAKVLLEKLIKFFIDRKDNSYE